MSSGKARALDVSGLPDHAFGSRSELWWGTLGIIAIEATVFVITIGSYFYLQGTQTEWPPAGTRNPDLLWPTINTALLLLSLVPNQKAKSAAEGLDVRGVRIWMTVADLFAALFLVLRVLEYEHLNVSWDSNAYGSLTWTLLGLHTLHLVTDLFDSVLLTALMFTQHGHHPKRMEDVSANAFYWYFVVLAWIPIYLVLYWSPRWL
jgi:heme/copper-type cytochrome/quinol oxidase subunit 3